MAISSCLLGSLLPWNSQFIGNYQIYLKLDCYSHYVAKVLGCQRPWTRIFTWEILSHTGAHLHDSDGLTRGRCTAYNTATPIIITCILTIVLFMISRYRWRPSKTSEKNWDDYQVMSSQSLGATSYCHQKFEDGSSSEFFEAIRLF